MKRLSDAKEEGACENASNATGDKHRPVSKYIYYIDMINYLFNCLFIYLR